MTIDADVRSLQMAVKRYPTNEALLNGTITSPKVHLQFEEVEPIHNAFAPMAQKQVYDLSEMAVFTFLQAYTYGKPIILMPLVMAARHQHGCLVFNKNFHDKLTPADLPGKRVGVRAYTQTTGAWVRNILMREHGLKLDSVKWIITEGAHLPEYREPPFVARAAPNKKLINMLMEGEVDAAILGNDLPDDPSLSPVIPNAAKAGPAWQTKTGLIPINHMFVATTELAKSRPDLVLEVYRLLERAKEAAGPSKGPDMRPIGIDAVRPSLELVIQLAAEQQIIPTRYSVDELFAPWREVQTAADGKA
jgi:4,5-dihydroxyphthalate decarboxylase